MPSSNAERARRHWWIPERRRGVEYLDDPRAVGADVVLAELADVSRANALFGGTRAVVAEVLALCDGPTPPRSLLDVGTGLGDIPLAARRATARRGVALEVMGLELSDVAARAAHAAIGAAVVADAFALPFPTGSVDVVTCSQVLHHFDAVQGARLLRELDRVARVRVIVSDLRRSWAAAIGLWLASYPLGFHPHSRHDGVTSVMRGFTPFELGTLILDSTSRPAVTRNRVGFRITAHWSPTSAPT